MFHARTFYMKGLPFILMELPMILTMPLVIIINICQYTKPKKKRTPYFYMMSILG